MTSAAIDTTGANFLVVATAVYTGGTGLTISDSKGNSWTPAIATSGYNPNGQIWYCASPIVGAGHTFTISGSTVYTSIAVAAFNGVISTSPLDQQSTNFLTAYPAKPGSITPGFPNELIVTYASTQTTGTVDSIDSGFTITDAIAHGTTFGISLAYLVQTVPAAVDPIWTSSSGDVGVLGIGSFRPGIAAPSSHLLGSLGVGA